MPCPISIDAEYPDYLKQLIKELSVGNDEEAKSCICANLRNPTNEEGCPIVDENNKLTVFPFCWTYGPPPLSWAQLPKLTAKQAMTLYWQSNSITNINLTYESLAFGGCPPGSYYYMRPDGNTKLEKRKFLNNGLLGSNKDVKKLLCPHYVSFVQDFELEDCDGQVSYNTYEVIKFFAGQNYVNKENGKYYFYPSMYTNIPFYTAVLTTEGCSIPCSPDELKIEKMKINGIDSEFGITEFEIDGFFTFEDFSFNNTPIIVNES